MAPIMSNDNFQSRRNTLSSFSLKNKVQYLKRNTIALRRHNSNSTLDDWNEEPSIKQKTDKTFNISLIGAPGT